MNPQECTNYLNKVQLQHIDAHRVPYYNWIRHLSTLATAALTALVALQGHYVPRSPVLPEILCASWVLLSIAVAAGIQSLATEWRLSLERAEKVHSLRVRIGDELAVRELRQSPTESPGPGHVWSVRVLLASISGAFLCLSVFAVANLMR